MPGTVRPLVTIVGTIRQVKSIRTRFKFHILEIVLSDDTGTAKVMFYNQPYLAKSFKEGERVLIFGPLTQGKYGVEFRVPHYELLGASTDELFVQRILPVYRRLGPITSKIRSKLIQDALDAVLRTIFRRLSGAASPTSFRLYVFFISLPTTRTSKP
jgi:ATP-dependent DNA helicase RecG